MPYHFHTCGLRRSWTSFLYQLFQGWYAGCIGITWIHPCSLFHCTRAEKPAETTWFSSWVCPLLRYLSWSSDGAHGSNQPNHHHHCVYGNMPDFCLLLNGCTPCGGQEVPVPWRHPSVWTFNPHRSHSHEFLLPIQACV